MTRKTKLDRQVDKLTSGITLTKAQRASVKKQVKAKKQPKLSIQRVTLSLPQLKEVQQLLKQAPKEYAGNKDKTAPDFLSAQQKREYRAAARRFNNTIRAYQAYETALRVKGLTQKYGISDEYPIAPIKAIQQFYKYRYEDARNITDLEHFAESMKFLTAFTSSNDSFVNRRALIQRNNWTQALYKRLGALADPIIEKTNAMPLRDFERNIQLGRIPHTGDIYLASNEELTSLMTDLADIFDLIEDDAVELDYDTDDIF